ncbi:DNA methyltransferase, partial [Acidianus hospitalis]
MSQNLGKRLIESDAFAELIPLIDKEAAREKGPGRPPYWEMIFWWTRKPLISARAFIAAALLPENFPVNEFKRMIRLSDSSKSEIPHKLQPITNGRFKDFTLLDPFAGFGSIPLEAKRLGVGKVIASELLPTAYVFLKAVLEYPKYGKKIIDDVKKYGDELLKSLEEDVKELYGDNNGFIGTWEVKCPHCGNYTPLVNQWWLMKMQGGGEESTEEGIKSGKFKRIVFMRPEINNRDSLRIKVVDLNKELNKQTIEAKVSKNKIIVSEKTYEVPEGNVNAKSNNARCLYCNNVFPGKGDKWYVREAIKEWNEKYEKYLNGEISLEELQNAKARPTLLVKFKGKGKDLEFNEIDEKDRNMFWRSFEKLRVIDINNIPIEKIAEYASRYTTIPWGMDKFYKLFNARQLIVFSKIITKLNEIREKIKENEKYREAIITYLTIAFLNHIRYNCMVTSVHPSRTFITHALAFRGIVFTWNWVEISPLVDIIGSLRRSLDHVIEGLEYLVQASTDS